VAVTSSIAASHFHALARQGYAPAAALTGGLHWALLVCGLAGITAIPVAALVIRRTHRSTSAVVTEAVEARDLALADC
jgi:hypothetical protein